MQDMLALLKAHRRALHRIPEGGHKEEKTKAYILSVLEALPVDKLDFFGKTGMRAIFLCGEKNAKTIAFRADMDGLPVPEKTGLDFASGHEGFMHACGHDGHMALLLTFAQYIGQNKGKLMHNIATIFQPAEENFLGARDMVRAGILENPRIDQIHGVHVNPSFNKGEIALSEGPVMAGNTSIDIVIHGKSAHGASPQLGADAILAASAVVLQLEAMLTRLSHEEPCLLSFGTVNGGQIRNALAGMVTLTGVLRYFSEERKQEMYRKIRETAAHTAQALGTQAEVFFDEKEYPPVINDASAVKHALPFIQSRVPQPMQMISEDFSCYLHERPGFFAFVGVKDEGHSSPLHADTFDFDEEALLPALSLYISLATNP